MKIAHVFAAGLLAALSFGCQGRTTFPAPADEGALTGDGGAAGDSHSTGGSSNGGEANGGSANGGSSNGGSSNGGSANGGSANGGSANGGSSNGGSANGGSSNGGSSNGGSSSACNPDNCDGCCDAADRCHPGRAINACGQFGKVCSDCSALGFECIARHCEGVAPECGPANCDGCCDVDGRCRFGSESDACGGGGHACDNCAVDGRGCRDGRCQGDPPARCGPENCGGCCDGDTCVGGTSNLACGANGQACQRCQSAGRICTQPGNYCAYVPSCTSATCPTGCCGDDGVCRPGRSNDACGRQGRACDDCGASGESCAPQGFCYSGPECGPGNCAGCCTATGECRGGSRNVQCGEFGRLCDNCTPKGEACQDRVCSSGEICPAAYPGCAPEVRTPTPFSSPSCSKQELERLAEVCAGPEPGPKCGDWWGDELFPKNPACYDCLLQFTGDGAYTKCISPFLTSNCNHVLTCAEDCAGVACGECTYTGNQDCQKEAFGYQGDCSEYVGGSYCADAAVQGPAAFCSVDPWDVGRWFAQVGAYYCGR